MNKQLREAALAAKELAELAAEGKAEAGVGVVAKCLMVVIEGIRELHVRLLEMEEREGE